MINMRNDGLGVAQRFADIFSNNVNVSLNPQDRGTLILKVGTGGSNLLIDRESTFDIQLAEMDKTIDNIQKKLYAAETKYYKQFAALETALARMNKQQAYLGMIEEQ